MQPKQHLEYYLQNVFNDYPEGSVKDAMYYALLNPGKRIRSQLFFKTLQLFEIKAIVEVASAIEMIHTYSLIHDDLPAMDNALLRRGKPTVHIQYSEDIAILAGDGLLTHSFNEITKTSLVDHLKVRFIQELVNASGINGMIYGQELDLLAENDLSINVTQLNLIYTNKTAAMIALPIRLALLIAKREDLLESWTNAMVKIGIAFQIKDDLLEIQNPDTIGKDISDVRNNKRTYPILLGVDSSKQIYHQLFNDALRIIKSADINTDLLIEYIESLVERNH